MTRDLRAVVARSTGDTLDEAVVMDRAALLAAAEQVAGEQAPSRRQQPRLRTVLDWSGNDKAPRARVGYLDACVHCGRGALLRHPATGRPCHKICEEDAIDRRGLVLFIYAARAVIARATPRRRTSCPT